MACPESVTAGGRRPWRGDLGHEPGGQLRRRRSSTAYDRRVSTRRDGARPHPLPLLVLGRGTRPAHRARGRVPRRPARALRPRPGRARPRGQGRARRPGVRARAPLPARRGHRVRRRHRRLVQAGQGRGRPAGRAVHRLLRRALHGRVRRHPHQRRADRDPARPRRRAARWPTWPRSARSRTAGTTWSRPASPTGTVPVTYMNSSAAIKAFTGRHGGTICTSSNAKTALDWAFDQAARRRRAARCCSCPTSTSAATPACATSAAPSTTAWSSTRTSPMGGLTRRAAAGRAR